MEWLGAFVVGAGITIFLYGLWWFVCNEITFRHRQTMIFDIETDEDWRRYRSVSYDEHLRALMGFRNPKKLYRDHR